MNRLLAALTAVCGLVAENGWSFTLGVELRPVDVRDPGEFERSADAGGSLDAALAAWAGIADEG
jgi:hypothetical protein